MKRVQARTLSGFMELLPSQQTHFQEMLRILQETYALFGFTPLDTPVIEASEVLLAKGGGETEQQIYRFEKGEHDLSLRYDLTVPLAKYVAMNQGQLCFPFRRFQIGKVYRGERPQRGRFREFYQADIDVVGNETLSVANDAEMPAVIYTALKKLGLERFVIRVNNRKILTGYYQILQLSEKSTQLMRIVDKLEKIGGEEVKALLRKEGIADPLPQEILDFHSLVGSGETVLPVLEQYKGKNETFDQGVEELALVCQYLSDFGVSQAQFQVDLSIARGLDYYTGTVYETMLTDSPEIGSICSGGRYDNLADYYTNKKLPGVGVSIGLTRLFYVLENQGRLNSQLNTAPCTALILPMETALQPVVLVASALRQAGVRTQLYLEDKKFKQKIAYADKIAVPFVVIIGEDETSSQCYTLRNMETGDQEKLPLDQLTQRLTQAQQNPVPPFQ